MFFLTLRKLSGIFYLLSILVFLFPDIATAQDSQPQTIQSPSNPKPRKSPSFGGPDAPDLILEKKDRFFEFGGYYMSVYQFVNDTGQKHTQIVKTLAK